MGVVVRVRVKRVDEVELKVRVGVLPTGKVGSKASLKKYTDKKKKHCLLTGIFCT